MRFLLPLLLVFSAAAALYPVETGYSVVEFNISGTASGAEVRLHLPVQSDTQTVMQVTDYATFKDSLGQYLLVTGSFSYSARIEVNSSLAEIMANPQMPLKTTGMGPFLSPTTKIQSADPEIMALAAGLASGDETELEAVAHVVSWANRNIKYVQKNQSEVYSVKTAREVFDSREGYCGEYAVLTAAMLRSLDIPAKYVIGYVYVGNEWLLHAWNEFYVPGSGWVSADSTYGQVGLIDATHIKIKDGNDPVNMGDTVSYTGANPSYNTKASLAMLQQGGFDRIFSSSLSLSPAHVGFGSLSRAALDIENLRNSWATPTVELMHSSELTVLTQQKILVVPPYGTSQALWDVNTPAAAPGPSDYEYSFFVRAKGQGISDEETLVASALAPVAVKGKLEITALSKHAGTGSIVLTMEIRNTGNVDIEALELSVASLSVSAGVHPSQKETFRLDRGESETVSFSFPRVDGVYSYDFSITGTVGGSELLSQSVNVAYEAPIAPEEELRQLLSPDQLASIFIFALVIIFLLIGAIFLAPFMLKPKKPFEGPALLKHVFEKEKVRYERRRSRKEAAKRFDFLAEFDEKK